MKKDLKCTFTGICMSKTHGKEYKDQCVKCKYNAKYIAKKVEKESKDE
jgi:hypothetical protein